MFAGSTNATVGDAGDAVVIGAGADIVVDGAEVVAGGAEIFIGTDVVGGMDVVERIDVIGGNVLVSSRVDDEEEIEGAVANDLVIDESEYKDMS